MPLRKSAQIPRETTRTDFATASNFLGSYSKLAISRQNRTGATLGSPHSGLPLCRAITLAKGPFHSLGMTLSKAPGTRFPRLCC